MLRRVCYIGVLLFTLSLMSCVNDDIKRGNDALRIGDYERAITNFSKALDVEPANRDARYGLALSFYAEEYRKALQICGSKSGRDTDKVALAGLTPLKLEDGTMTFDEARMTVCCRKLFATDMIESDFADAELYKKFYNANAGGTDHTMYIVEIESVYTK